MSQTKNFRVVIVGGSIAGLTLAHSLERANIDYVVLEAYNDIAPQVGASIGVLPNGARILDQLGIYDDILDEVEPMKDHPSEHGYPVAFLDRQIVLAILYKHLGDSQSRVHLEKKVVRVEHVDSGVIAHCADGSSFNGDIVVGADGVKSTIRQQMWQHMMDIKMHNAVKREKAKMKSEYSCVFGISNATPGLKPGESHRSFGDGFSSLIIIGKEGRVFWFLFTRLEQTYSMSTLPRFTPDDLKQNIASHLDKYVAAGVPFAAVYKNAITTTYVPLEEAFYKYWTVDKFVCIGDSIHKMTPNMGQGGNSAIESAASLANILHSFVNSSSTYSLQDLRSCLSSWESSRQPRVNGIWAKANDLTRLEALATWKHKIVGLYMLPHLTSILTDKTSRSIVGAEKLDFIPVKGSQECLIPYDKNYRNIQDEPGWKRFIWALPLLSLLLVAFSTMDATLVSTIPYLGRTLLSGTWESSTGEAVSLYKPQYHWQYLDDLFRPMITCFLPSISGSHPLSKLQINSFLTDLGPIYAIWLLESYRRAHHWSMPLLPILFGLAFQLKGIGKFAPIYFLLDFMQSPLSKILVADSSYISPSLITMLFPALILGYYIPTWASFVAPTLAMRQSINAGWQLFPLIVPALQVLLMLAMKIVPAKLRPRVTLSTRFCSFILAVVSGAAFIHVRMNIPDSSSLLEIFLPSTTAPAQSFSEGIARFLQYDEIFSMGSALIWLLLCFRDLQLYGVVVSWVKVVGVLATTTCLFGPGAAVAIGWGWREEILAGIMRDRG
ncbi:hypothetical protein MW887_001187 [Aspergillus wentii]|nr:hypothetical protein MW887_001187 [Aspergillus wentii]